MNTVCQTKANRKNAIKSTGPRSIQGKNRSSKNALKHGVLSKQLIIHDENAEDFENLKELLYQNLLPEGSLEEILVEEVAITI